jgi:hypothetical protein
VLHVGQHTEIGVQGDAYDGVPEISETILGLTFLPSKRVVHVCRRFWGRMSGSPAFARSEGPLARTFRGHSASWVYRHSTQVFVRWLF